MSNWIAASLFLFAAAVQYNDPDPLRWMAIYTVAAVIALIVAVRGSLSAVVPLAVSIIALVWLMMIASNGSGLAAYAHMFDAWEMKSAQVEEAREVSGLLIIAIWMIVIAARMWIHTPKDLSKETGLTEA